MTGEESPAELPSTRPRASRRAGAVWACAVAAWVAAVAPAAAQVSEDTQLWLSATTSGAVSGPWRASAEIHARWADDVQHYQRTVLRLQGGHAFGTRVVAWFGFEESWPYAGRIPEETRIWQQVLFVHPAAAWVLSHRARLEERFIGGADRMVPRFRYSLRATRPFRPGSVWGVIAGGEIFFQLRDAFLREQPYPAGLDRDRLQAGLSRRLSRTTSVEPSYLLQFINAPQPLPNRREHLIQVQLVHRF